MRFVCFRKYYFAIIGWLFFNLLRGSMEDVMSLLPLLESLDLFLYFEFFIHFTLHQLQVIGAKSKCDQCETPAEPTNNGRECKPNFYSLCAWKHSRPFFICKQLSFHRTLRVLRMYMSLASAVHFSKGLVTFDVQWGHFFFNFFWLAFSKELLQSRRRLRFWILLHYF